MRLRGVNRERSSLRGCRVGKPAGLAQEKLPGQQSRPKLQDGFSGNRVVFIKQDFEWSDGSVIAAELAPGHSWEIAWDGFYLWRGNWDSHPANPESSFPGPRRTYKEALVENSPSNTPICK